MEHVHYSVTATLPNKDLLCKYLEWLQNGHIHAVLQGGALRAQVVQLEAEDGSLRVRTLYEFANPQAFTDYVRDHAPALRADGLARFGPHTGTRFEREQGTIRQELKQIGQP